MAIESPNVGYA